MDLHELERNWNTFGETDPFWAILTQEGKQGNKFDKGEFFQSGRTHVVDLFGRLNELDLMPCSDRALDFGCGVGRISQALCDRFARVDGVDIASSMIEKARKLNRFGTKCHYQVNPNADLSIFDDASFDFVFSVIVLQHMRPEYAAGYVCEFLRILRVGGIAVFQQPSRRIPVGRPLSKTGFRARIEPQNPPERGRSGQDCTFTALVHNESNQAWPHNGASDYEDRYRVKLGNHWRDANGEVLTENDGRGPLGEDLEPGETTQISITVRFPEKAGVYILELDMVQEAIAWFRDQGSPTWMGRVIVVAAVDLAETSPTREVLQESVMEMHGIPRPQLLELLETEGGEVILAEPNDWAPGFESYTYYVRKGGA